MTGVSLRPFRPTFYPIVAVEVCREYRHDPLAVAAACFRGGATLLQLRQKHGRGAEALALADAVVEAAREYGAAVIVNDRADIARLSGAAGVHVGQDDLTVDDVRRVVGNGAMVGLSTHNEAQIDQAREERVDYIAVGPIYGTATKDTGYTARGLDLIRYAARGSQPVAAIGGITLERAGEVVAAGATLIAVISDILREDPERRTRQFIDLLHV
ncbi:MAG: thiamine phosphate synthase [Vicinamibacterales bacterium]